MGAKQINEKELWTGILYVGLGLAGLLVGRDYGFGSPGQMGAGFFPMILSGLLGLVGLVSLARAFLSSHPEGGRIEPIYLKGLALVVGGTLLFAWAMPRLGLAIALPALLLMSALASSQFRLGLRPVMGLLAFSAACILLFAEGLGVPMPILGSYFGS